MKFDNSRVEVQDPLKQGLKQRGKRKTRNNRKKVEVHDPLKQGLKRIGEEPILER